MNIKLHFQTMILKMSSTIEGWNWRIVLVYLVHCWKYFFLAKDTKVISMLACKTGLCVRRVTISYSSHIEVAVDPVNKSMLVKLLSYMIEQNFYRFISSFFNVWRIIESHLVRDSVIWCTSLNPLQMILSIEYGLRKSVNICEKNQLNPIKWRVQYRCVKV